MCSLTPTVITEVGEDEGLCTSKARVCAGFIDFTVCVCVGFIDVIR